VKSFLKDPDEKFLDFVERCLTWDPKTRLTPEEALHHPWITDGIAAYERSCRSRAQPPQKE
jgi:dual specificity tyrosine-phosphorylation-regulated kinase 2/3/4